MEIYGREGALVIRTSGSANIGPNVLYGARGKDVTVEMPAPDKYKLVPEGTPGRPAAQRRPGLRPLRRLACAGAGPSTSTSTSPSSVTS